MANHPILLDEGGQLLAWPKGEWAEPHPKLAPYYRRIGQLVDLVPLENSITYIYTLLSAKLGIYHNSQQSQYGSFFL